MYDHVRRHLPEFVAIAISLAAHRDLYQWVTGQGFGRWRAVLRVGVLLSLAWVVLATLFHLPGLFAKIPYWSPLAWVRGVGLAWTLAVAGAWAIHRGWLLWVACSPRMDPSRRRFLQAAKTAVAAAPGLALGYGTFIARSDITLKEVSVPMIGLAPALDGLRLVQITDIHLSPFFPAHALERAIRIANETKAHVALVTGDLVTASSDPVDECLRLLTKLKADAGVLGCLGNHEIAAGCEDYVQSKGARIGMRFLRQEATTLRFGGVPIHFAGYDYQQMGRPYLTGAENLVEPGMINVLLSHSPDVFPVAAAKGFDLTVAGHTHGGQVTVEILNQYLNLVRFYTPYVYGHYRLEGKSAYVSRGLGTVGVPARVGAPPEVSLIKLCAISS